MHFSFTATTYILLSSFAALSTIVNAAPTVALTPRGSETFHGTIDWMGHGPNGPLVSLVDDQNKRFFCDNEQQIINAGIRKGDRVIFTKTLKAPQTAHDVQKA